MLALLLAGLSVAASPSPTQASPAAEESQPRRICVEVPVSNSRFTKRVCKLVAATPAMVVRAPAPPLPPPVMTTLGVGMAVVDTNGGAVGIVTALATDSVTVKTDKHQAHLPRTSLTVSDGKALFGLTQAALDASIEQSLAAIAMAALKVGAAVKGTGGESVGTIDAVEADKVTIRLASGLRISVPRSGIAAGTDGSGTIGITAAALEAQVKAAQPTH